MDLGYLVELVEEIIEDSGWKIEKKTVAATGSVYYDLVRDGREWVVIRVADHQQFYFKFLTTYSIDPSRDGLYIEELESLLGKPFGEVGDVLL